jgi:hypothetical protein
MKSVVLSVVLFAASHLLFAYTSGIAISSDKSVVVQVFINGKLYNKVPSHFIRIKSTEGLFHLRVKILNLRQHTWQEVRQTVRITKGFEYQYTIVQKEGKSPELRQTKRYPIYSRYFLDYSLYSRSYTS